MPRRPDQQKAPRDYLHVDGRWPTGPWEPGTPTAVRYAAAIAARLAEALNDQQLTVTEAAHRIGVVRRTLHATLSGQVMPDLRTVALAEQALHLRLWPDTPPGA